MGLVLLIPAVAAWAFGRTFIFPSLGPSAYYLVVTRRQDHRLYHVIGGHLIGVSSGLASYWLLARHAIIEASSQPFSTEGLHLMASGVLSVVLTTALMRLLRVAHPPACATTLIVSLGLLSTVQDGFLIMIAVVVMAFGYRLLRRLEGMP